MGFKLKSGNAPKFKMVGSKPGPPSTVDNEASRRASGTDSDDGEKITKIPMQEVKQIPTKPIPDKLTVAPQAKLGDGVDNARASNAQFKKENKGKNWWEEGYGEESKESNETGDKYNADGSLVEEKKSDYFSDIRPLLDLVSGKKRKAKKAEALKNAKANVGSGNETLKGTKLIDKANKKQRKSDIKEIKASEKDKIKLAKYKKRKAKKLAKRK